MSAVLALAGGATMLILAGEEGGNWPTQGMLGGFLLSLGLVAWLAIALFFSLGVMPKLWPMRAQKMPGIPPVDLFDTFYLTGFFLQLLSFFGALDLTIAAHFGFASPLETKLWLGLCLFTLALNLYGRWGLTPAMHHTAKKWQEAGDEASRLSTEAVLRSQLGWVKMLNGLQVLAILVALGLFVSANAGSPVPEKRQPTAIQPPVNLPSGGPKVIFKMPPAPLSPASRPVPTPPMDSKTHAP